MLFHFLLPIGVCLAATILDSHSSDVDLVSMIENVSKTRPKLVDRGLQLVQSLKSAPSCHRLATATLIDSCKELENPTESANLILDGIKSTFAARLAICEITGAHANIPEQCLSMVPQPDASRSHGLRCRIPGFKCGYGSSKTADGNWGYTRVQEPKLKECLKALESRPQWWISYSNARQNAVVLCHATRYELERDEKLQTFESLVGTAANVDEALAHAAQKSAQHLAQQRDFAKEISLLQRQLMKDLEDSQGTAKTALHTLFRDTEKGIQSLLSIVTGKSRDAGTFMDELSEKIKESRSAFEEHRVSLSNSMQHLKLQTDQETRIIASNLEKSVQFATALDTIATTDLQHLQQTAMQTQEQMTALVRVVLQFHDRLATSEQGLDMLTRTMVALQAQSHTLEKGFTTHVGAMESFWATQQETTQQQIAALAAAQASADTLAATVNDQAARLPGVMASLAGGAGSSWTWSVVFLLPWGLERTLGRSAAGIIVAAFAACIVFYTLLWRLLTCGGVITAYSYISHAASLVLQGITTVRAGHSLGLAAIIAVLFVVGAAFGAFIYFRQTGGQTDEPKKGTTVC